MQFTTMIYNSEYIMVQVNMEIYERLQAYLIEQDDSETTISAIIANWIDTQKIADMQESK